MLRLLKRANADKKTLITVQYIEHVLDQYWNVVTKFGVLISQNIFQMTLKGFSVEL